MLSLCVRCGACVCVWASTLRWVRFLVFRWLFTSTEHLCTIYWAMNAHTLRICFCFHSLGVFGCCFVLLYSGIIYHTYKVYKLSIGRGFVEVSQLEFRLICRHLVAAVFVSHPYLATLVGRPKNWCVAFQSPEITKINTILIHRQTRKWIGQSFELNEAVK